MNAREHDVPTFPVWVVCSICGHAGDINGTSAKRGTSPMRLSADELADLIRDIATTACSVCGGPLSIKTRRDTPDH